MKSININKFLLNKSNLYLESLLIFIFGLLAGLVFLKVFFLPLTILAFNYLFYVIIRKKYDVIQILIIGSLFGTGKFISSLYWIAVAFEMANYGGIELGIFAVFLLSFVLSLFIGAACMILKLINNHFQPNKVGCALIFVCLLSFFEYLRGICFGGFPWNIIGYIWANSYLTLQGASWIGIYGLSLLTYLAFMALSFLLNKLRYVFYFIFPLLIVMLLGFLRILLFENTINNSISVKIVQPSINQKEKLDGSLNDEHLNKLIKLSTESTSYNSNIIIWPESAVNFDIEKNHKKSKEIFSWMKKGQLLITGATRRSYKGAKVEKVYNSIFLVGENAKLYTYYDKQHLVPFGEFIPLRKFLNMNNLVGNTLDFSSGKGKNIFILPESFLSVALLVCYEIIFPAQIIKGERPDLIINLTNDAWYGNTDGPEQHLMSARTRAVEEGIPILRAANTGISAVIDANGRYIDLLAFSKQGIINAYVPNKIKPTFFSKYGNLPFLFLSVFILVLGRLFKDR